MFCADCIKTHYYDANKRKLRDESETLGPAAKAPRRPAQ